MRNKFFVLWFGGIVAATAVLPYAFTLQSEVIEQVGKPMYVIVFASIIQTAVLLAVAIFFGLKFSKFINLPVLSERGPGVSLKEKFRNLVLFSVPLGVVTGLVIMLGDWLFGKYTPELSTANSQVEIWKTLLASLYGGIVEEILMRLFIVSLFAWLLGKIFKATEVVKSSAIMWTAIVIAAVLFGLGHLPITSSITQITPLVVTRAIVLNGIGGLVFGWLYWKRGLEYSIVSHFTTDIVLLAVLPLFFN